ncbi:glycoside hydrolase family 47 protein [Phanerochaete carnosa HHB-10118-sp]|uniref:alpha-1,2-Mannosidase n=1 Tax=Phanerochaete carnosa (strain HHB-10118-sp) TaxID=650164 RepID=K5WG90_PHACS|nr:glycoside hydrolase family 47 protein [Phanerochaete carnosa HHB-10118-sp]EKM58119.1 glycoside hydrolase family 47 protein [Phanerochaete carnosa HHB-10118-sp]
MRNLLAAVALLSTFRTSGVTAERVQNPVLNLPSDASAQQQAVKNIFLESYSAYKQFAFGHDDLEPISKSFTDGRNGWGATIFDALDTLFLMGETELFEEGVDFVGQVDFNISHTTDTVSVFETSIRYLGGALSAYELSGKKYPILVQKAKEVADKMSVAWVGSNKVPFGEVDFNTSTPEIATSNIAEAGTLTLEWSRLSQYTGNDTYRQLAEGSVRQIISLPDPLPGLAGQGIDPSTGETSDAYVTWGGGSDSYFEYLIKYPRLTNTNDTIFADTWATAVDSSIRTLLVTSTVGDHKYLADFDETGNIINVGSHLACYMAGNWLMGGKLLNNNTIVDIALQLMDGCWNTYASTATGIGPEAFAYFSNKGNITDQTVTAEDLAFYEEHGFFIQSGAFYYLQRPEVLESNFYAWRVTGDTKYLDRAASAIQSFQKFLTTPGLAGFAPIWNVTDTDVMLNTNYFMDDTQSFWFAEVLKYLWLTFDDPNNISLDEWVFNTECHPLQAPPELPQYGSGQLTTPKKLSLPFTSTAKLPQFSFAPILGPNQP